ncbi:cfem domain-containing protein [Alternaria burnsii]|uniref:Cfem domain-containing protein n=1 Tax=Alternaria burnsii TaxID=1187904 RepID=A0A8H7AWV6_9PLEO|nr:cfem domain-containing protein [Alternaria burnsii]KAF7670786.1 cfem domain-containing protein [Alternaria burnsii]
MLTNGIGVDLWTAPFDHLEHFVRWLYTITLLYFIQCAMVKVLLILFFLRIFPRRRTVQLLWGTIAFIVIWTISFFIPGSFPCLPLADYWTAWDKAKPTKCLNIYAVIWVHATICIVVDIWMLSIPLYEVFHLQMTLTKKFSVALMFFVGTFVTIVSILRLRSLIAFGGTSNVT